MEAARKEQGEEKARLLQMAEESAAKASLAAQEREV